MTLKEMIERLPAPTTPEEILIYNFLKGEDVYSTVGVAKSRDQYLEVFFAFLKEKLKAKPVNNTSKKKAEG